MYSGISVLSTILFGLFITQGCWSAQVEIYPRETLVLPRQNVTFMCKVAVPLQYCRVEIPGKKNLNLNTQLSTENVRYSGAGLDAGQCGFTINNVEEKNNGIVRCTLGIQTESQESVGQMHLVVAKPPRSPELELSRGTDSVRVYKINDVLHASCVVRDGRPVANISWYLDEEPLLDEGLSMPEVVDIAKENLQSKSQNLTRQLRASDNGKKLRCVAYHPAYLNGRQDTARQLDVKYAPQPLQEPLEQFGFALGQPGMISLIIESNPRPKIEWIVGGQKIREGSNDQTGRMEAEGPKELGQGRYEINLRVAGINKEDTEKQFTLTAYNDMGSQSYNVRISTSPEPEGLELGVGSIIGIVIAISVVLILVFLLIFAKTTGRWCFSGPRERHFTESDTESADDRPKRTKLHLPPMPSISSLFRKNKEKLPSDQSENEPQPLESEEIKVPLDTTLAHPDNGNQEGTKEGVVYAELDLANPGVKAVIKNEDDKTEYAEIVYTPKDANKNETKDK